VAVSGILDLTPYTIIWHYGRMWTRKTIAVEATHSKITWKFITALQWCICIVHRSFGTGNTCEISGAWFVLGQILFKFKHMFLHLATVSTVSFLG